MSANGPVKILVVDSISAVITPLFGSRQPDGERHVHLSLSLLVRSTMLSSMVSISKRDNRQEWVSLTVANVGVILAGKGCTTNLR